MMPPTPLDIGLVAVTLACMVGEVLAFGAAGGAHARPDVRLRSYAYMIVYQWTLVGCVLVLWGYEHRPWVALLLGAPHPLGFAAVTAIALGYVALALVQRRTLARRPDLFDRVRAQFGGLEGLLPHTAEERRWWTVVALTAGCCEEVLFRGFLLAVVASITGLVAAAAITILAFGVYHAYQGWSGIVKTGAFGLLATGLVLLAGSLLPVMLLHAAIDYFSGDLGYRVLGATER
jgi:membrane protease YdiL (CAAX protease family)